MDDAEEVMTTKSKGWDPGANGFIVNGGGRDQRWLWSWPGGCGGETEVEVSTFFANINCVTIAFRG